MLCSYTIAVKYEPKEEFEATYIKNKSTFDA